MKRKVKLFINTISSIFYQIIAILCGLILPKLIISKYGSEINGLVSSITQFLGIIGFLELGVGAVVQSTLYKPLSEGNFNFVSKILSSANNYFKKIALILVVYVVLLIFIYPIFFIKTFSYIFSGTLIFAIAISYFNQYYFALTYQILLNADQLSYIQLITQSIILILNTLISIYLVRLNVSIQVLKLVSSIIFTLRPIVFKIVIKKYYKINIKEKYEIEPIPQKWNGIAQHISFIVLNNANVIILTIFSNLKNVSIYSIYNLVVTGVTQLINAITIGISSTFGNMIAKEENKLLLDTFNIFERTIHSLITLIFTITAILIVPFIKIYTKNVDDLNYIVPIFPYVLTISQAAYCIRLPYNILVLAAGHYRQTQKSALIESVINIFISIALVKKFGLVGVGIGTLAAMVYRIFYLVQYLSKNIVKRKIRYFLINIFIDIGSAFLMVMTTRNIICNVENFKEWIILAIKVTILCCIESIIINLYYFIKYKYGKRK